MQYKIWPDTTLVIGTFSSTCNNCGRDAKLDEKTHDTELGYSGRGKGFGCGIEWTHVASSYIGLDIDKRIKELRPDLELITFEEISRSFAS